MNDEQINKSTAPLLTHLIELRTRLLYCLAFFMVMFGAGYYFSADIYHFLQQPLLQQFGEGSERRMIYTGLQEAFFTYLKLAFFTALFFSVPLILIQG